MEKNKKNFIEPGYPSIIVHELRPLVIREALEAFAVDKEEAFWLKLPDFRVTGKGKYSHVTHVEVKNPVGSNIEKVANEGVSDIVKQGNKIGRKVSDQQKKWSDPTFRETLSNINPNAVFPQSPAYLLGLVDEFDVPISEKRIVQDAIENTCTNSSNVVFLNNDTNI